MHVEVVNVDAAELARKAVFENIVWIFEVVLAEVAPEVVFVEIAPEVVLVEVPKIGNYTVLQDCRTRNTKSKTK